MRKCRAYVYIYIYIYGNVPKKPWPRSGTHGILDTFGRPGVQSGGLRQAGGQSVLGEPAWRPAGGVSCRLAAGWAASRAAERPAGWPSGRRAAGRAVAWQGGQAAGRAGGLRSDEAAGFLKC